MLNLKSPHFQIVFVTFIHFLNLNIFKFLVQACLDLIYVVCYMYFLSITRSLLWKSIHFLKLLLQWLSNDIMKGNIESIPVVKDVQISDFSVPSVFQEGERCWRSQRSKKKSGDVWISLLPCSSTSHQSSDINQSRAGVWSWIKRQQREGWGKIGLRVCVYLRMCGCERQWVFYCGEYILFLSNQVSWEMRCTFLPPHLSRPLVPSLQVTLTGPLMHIH